jgi:acyl-CoA synthetase (AMP-forming)/AMP-acid ligase II
MLGQMMSLPLSIPSLIRHADRWHGDTPVVSRLPEGGVRHQDWRETHRRARLVGAALKAMGMHAGERVGTIAWNTHRHLEIYYGVSGSGLVCHTVNPRLFPDQIAWIVNDANDKYVFFDVSFMKLVEGIAPRCPRVRGWIAMTDRAHLPETELPIICYEDILAGTDANFDWPEIDEKAASSLCYTSGTTGDPKGALYSHRSTLLHSFAACMPDAFGLSASEVVLPVVPMFHVNAWGIPYAAAMVGSKLVMPGPGMDGASLFGLFESEGVTLSAGVPTIWLALLNYMEQNGLTPSTLKRVVIGGAAAPPSMIRAFHDRHGIEVLHAWGMTELSPLGTVNTFKAKHRGWDESARDTLREKQGRPLFGIDLRIAGANDAPLPHDGTAFGDLQVRGHWVIDGYFKESGGPALRDGWFPTGDVSTIDADGYMKITDRSKDVIKSGGEWISSIDIEGHVMAHAEVAEAAVIGVKHPKWDERPVLVVVRKPGTQVSAEALLAFLQGRIAKWWMPDDVIFVESLPHTATGKLSKLELRKQLADYALPQA